MSTDGILEYQGTKRVLYRGDTSNIVFDTRTTSLGIGVTGSNNPSSNLYITGNAYVSSNLEIGGVMTMGVVNVTARHNLQAITAIGNVTTQTVEFTNPTTAFTTTGNVSDLNIVSNVNMLHTSNTASIKLNSNVVTEFPRSKKLIKYPRVALTQNALNNGYTVSANAEESVGRAVWKLFDNTGNATAWRSEANGDYNASGAYTGSANLGSDSGGTAFADADKGDWVKIQLPYKIKLDHFTLQVRNSPSFPGGSSISYGRSEFIKNGKVWGSNDGTSWSVVHTISGTSAPSDTAINSYTVTSSIYYRYFGLVITDTNATVTGLGTSLSEIELYGVPEYDPEAHGTDVVVKSVPNVPNTDWLEVYYDGQDYTSMPATVTDKSGNNRTGTPSGGVGFDTGYKAFTFDGANDYISSTTTATLSNHTASMWIKFDSPAAWEAVYSIKPASGFDRNNFILYVNSTYFRLESSGNTGPYYDLAYNFVIGKWVHLTLVFRGSGLEDCEMYIDNVRLYPDGGQRSITDDITITGTNTIYVGSDPSGYYLDGSIANFRIFNRALTTDEIYQLYAYQKEYFGHGDLSMTLKAGRLGIGTSEPRAALDVKGEIRAVGSMFYLLDTPIISEWYWTGSTSSTGAEVKVIYSQLPENCRAVNADVFLPQASANDHGSHTLGRDHKNIGSLWTVGRSSTTANQPTSYMTTGVTQGSNVVFLNQPGQSDNHEWYYGNWWPSLTIPLAPGNVLYHARDGFGGGTSGWILVYVKGYYV